MADHNSLETITPGRPDISMVIPLLNEAESLPELCERIAAHTAEMGLSYEIIFVDDGSSDDLWQVIKQLTVRDTVVHAIKFRHNCGKPPALRCGFAEVCRRVVIMMSTDLRNAPEETGEIYSMTVHEGYDLVSEWKKKRCDPLSETVLMKLSSAAARRVSGIKNLYDFSYGLRAHRAGVAHSTRLYNDMHRYVPYLAEGASFTKIGEQVIHHTSHKYRHSKFGLDQFSNGYLNLLTFWFTHRFGRKPMRLPGFRSSFMSLIGFITLIMVLSFKFSIFIGGTPAPLATDRVYFYVSLATIIIGVQLFCAGFVGEMITRRDPNRDIYNAGTEL